MGLFQRLREAAVTNLIVGFIVVATMLFVGVQILYNMETAMPVIPGTSAWNTTQSSLVSMITGGFGLIQVSIIILAAVAILSVIYMIGGGDGKGGM